MSRDYKNISSGVESILGVNCVIRRRRQTDEDKRREIFVQIVNWIEETIVRSNICYVETGIDYSNYDDKFLTIIDALIYMQFGAEAAELISFYVWDRMNSDSTINPITDEEGREIYLNNPYELWDVLCRLNPKM